MRTSHSFLLYSALVICLSTSVSAWPWPQFLPHLDSFIVRRQGNDTNNDDNNNTTVALPPSSSFTPSNSGSTTGKPSNTKTTPTATKHTSYDARLPAGGIALITPAVSSGAQYYKAGGNITFAWNYTSLSATPTALNIMATCQANNQLYTIAANQTIGNSTGTAIWDTAVYNTAAVQLITETYTLLMYDAESSVSARPEAGYLAPYAQYTFGMYISQPYTPLSEGFQCVTCSGALSEMERRALGFVLGMGLISILSGMWFMGGLNIIW